MTATEALVATRDAYRDSLLELMADDDRVFCLDSDTGLFAHADFGAAGDRYLNLGIAEHNLIGTAAGMAASGAYPFVTTMATFALVRAAEAVKIDVVYNRLPVRIAGTHAGLAAGHLGPTHHCLEDLALVQALPGIQVAVPADAEQAAAAVAHSAHVDGPLYLRLGKSPTPALSSVAPDAPAYDFGRAQPLRAGTDVLIVACGPHPVLAAVAAADHLAGLGIGAAVLNLHTLRPLDIEAVVAAAQPVKGVVTVEEHWRSGGLGSTVAAVLCERVPRRLVRVAMTDAFCAEVGPQEHLLQHYGISDIGVVRAVGRLLGLELPEPPDLPNGGPS